MPLIRKCFFGRNKDLGSLTSEGRGNLLRGSREQRIEAIHDKNYLRIGYAVQQVAQHIEARKRLVLLAFEVPHVIPDPCKLRVQSVFACGPQTPKTVVSNPFCIIGY